MSKTLFECQGLSISRRIVEMKKVPILFLIFKRKEQALMAFEPIRRYRPERLYIAADGPRESVDGEKDECESTRKAILDSIDWDCKLMTLFRNKNLGCTDAVNGGITWFFEHEEYGIINEDDIVLSQDFFTMCEILLPMYKDDRRIMVISSRNHSGKYLESDEYCFVNYVNIWGWASWRRAWLMNTQDFSGWDSYPKITLIKRYGVFCGLMTIYYYYKCSNPNIKFYSWDYVWCYNIAKNNGIAIAPRVNLSQNIGIGVEGSANYNINDKDPYAHLKVGHIKWPIKILSDIMPDKEQQRYDRKDFFRVRMIGLNKKIRNLFHL